MEWSLGVDCGAMERHVGVMFWSGIKSDFELFFANQFLHNVMIDCTCLSHIKFCSVLFIIFMVYIYSRQNNMR